MLNTGSGCGIIYMVMDMLTEKEKMQRAKFYLLMLCSGVDPVTKEPVNADTLKNERILKCFRYVSDVLDDTIYGRDRVPAERKSAKTKKDFFITEDELKRVEILPDGAAISEIAAAINSAVSDDSRKKLQSKTINDWLVSQGYLMNRTDEKGRNHRELTEKSADIGITSAQGMGTFGPYTIVLYSEEAQRFILSHINEITNQKEE